MRTAIVRMEFEAVLRIKSFVHLRRTVGTICRNETCYKAVKYFRTVVDNFKKVRS